MNPPAGSTVATAPGQVPGDHASALLDALRAQCVVCVTDACGTIIEANDAFCALTGYDRAALLGATHRLVNSGHHPKSFFAEMWRRILAGQSWRGDIRNRARNGTLFWVDCMIAPLPGPDGRVARFVSILTDITTRKALEQAARDSDEQRADRMFETTPAMLHSIDADGCLISVSDAWLAALGYERDEVLGRPPWDFMTPRSRDEIVSRIAPEFFRTGHAENVECEMVRKDGRVIDVLASAVLERDAAGQPVRSSAVMVDITPRKQAQRRLAASEDRFKRLVDDHSELVAVVDIDGVMTYANHSFARQFGRSPDAMVGTSVYDHLPEREHEGSRERVRRVATTRETISHEIVLRSPDGAQRWFAWIISPLTDSEGRVTAIHSVGRDITDRKRIETELEEANERFAVAAKAAGLGFWHRDIKANHVTWDDWMYRLYGRSRSDTLTPFEIWVGSLHPEDLARSEQTLRDAISGKTPGFDMEFRIIRPDGEIRHIKAAGTAKLDADGTPAQLFGVNFDITEQKRNETELIRANRRFAIASDAAGMGFWEWNIPNGAVTWDDRMYRLYERAPAEVEDPMALWRDSLHPDDRAGSDQLVQDILQGRASSYAHEFRIILKDGGVRHLRVAATVIRDRDGTPLDMFGVNFDITERKRIEEELRHASERFAIAADAAGIGFFDWDIKANTLTWDDWMFRLYGRARSDGVLPYEVWAGNLHPDDRAQSERESRAAIDGLIGRYNSEFRVVHRDGNVRDILASATVLRDADGSATHMLGINVDITERKQMAEGLKRANRRFAIAADAAGIGFWHWDIRVDVLTWDDWMFRLYGRSPSDGAPSYAIWASTLHPDDRARAEEEGFIALEGGKPYDTEFRVVHPDGQIRHLKATASISRDGSGKAVHLYGVNFDITERKQAEIRLNRLVNELRRSNADLENFAYVASHDLKSPLRGIHQIAGWIAADLHDSLTAETRENLHLMQNRIDRMGRLLDDLLAYSRAGRSDGEIVTVDTRALITDIFDLVATRKAIRLQLGATLPTLRTRKAPLELVFRNLIGNAIKHHDKPQGCIGITAEATDSGFEFTVRDDGPGIAPEHHRRVFGMFQTLKSRDDVEGSGMGLAIIKKTVESVNGTVTLESDGRQGCVFRFTWPADIAAVVSERDAVLA